MEKLGEIAIDNSFNVTVTCQVDQQLLARNFTTIINALKELQDKQIKTDSQLKDLSSLKERFDQLGAKVDRFEKTSHSTGPASNSGQGDFAAGDLDSLSKRVDRNESNIMDNIKDINLINKDLVDVKKLIEDLRNQVAHTNPQGAERGEKSGYGVTDIASNMSK
jgi:peptidoglycan hydrolase CwlO-like protein